MFSLLIAATYSRTGFGIRLSTAGAVGSTPLVSAVDRVVAE
jgi:hypothetical protein